MTMVAPSLSSAHCRSFVPWPLYGTTYSRIYHMTFSRAFQLRTLFIILTLLDT